MAAPQLLLPLPSLLTRAEKPWPRTIYERSKIRWNDSDDRCRRSMRPSKGAENEPASSICSDDAVSGMVLIVVGFAAAIRKKDLLMVKMNKKLLSYESKYEKFKKKLIADYEERLSKLQLNNDKTELMFITPSKLSHHPSLPSTISINDSSVPVSLSVRSLGVILDQNLSFEKQAVSNICKIAYLELRRINSIRHFLSTEAAKTLVCAFVLSRIDYSV